MSGAARVADRPGRSGGGAKAALAVAGAMLAVAAGSTAAPVVPAFERFHGAAGGAAAAVEGGLLLLNELNCTACHAAPEGWRERVPGRGKIRLDGVGGRLGERTIAAYVAGPAEFEPGTTMPRTVAGADEARALAAFLAAGTGGAGGAGGATRETPKRFPAGEAGRGRQLFESVGCAACHAPEGATTTYASVPLGLARHTERNALAAFLQNPLHLRPAGRMPATELSDMEAADLAAYLTAGTSADGPGRAGGSEGSGADGSGASGRQSEAPEANAGLGAGLVDRGREVWAARNCAACHEVGGGAAAVRAARPLAAVRDGQGCLGPEPTAGVPWYALSAAQRAALGAAVQAMRTTERAPVETAERRVTRRFEQLNCYACHEWRGRGGAEPGRAALFTAKDAAAESLGEIGHLPPKLDTAGRKLTPEWLAKVLWGEGGGVRPYLSARMPKFGEAAAGDLPAALAEACRPERPQTIDTSGSVGHQRFAIGRTLLGTGTGGLGCVACHGLKNQEPAGVRAINLTHTARRLQPEYFKALLLDPQGVQSGTVMPPLLAGRKTADKDVESMWTYFKELDQSEVLPEGLARAGSFELKPEAEGRPIVFRTFLEGAGTQAIAVGFPAGRHAAFDAYEVRWALVWRGRFLDAQTNWEERPMKPIRPLGDAVRVLPTHGPLARGEGAAAAWPAGVGAAAGYTFRGYRIGADGGPTFRYAVGGIEVEDTLRPVGNAEWRRTLELRGGPGRGSGGWYFRGLAEGAEPRPVEWRDGRATLEETLTVSP